MTAPATPRLVLAIPGLALGLLAAPSLSADTLVRVNGDRIENVQVTTARHDSVQFKPATGPAQTLPGNTFTDMVRESPLLQGARAALAAGEWEKALKDFSNVARGAGATEWEKAEASYRIGLCHRGAGRFKEAETALKEFTEKAKGTKDFFLPFAIRDFAETLLGRNQPGTAEIHFRELEPFGGYWVFVSKLGQAECLLARGKSEAAKALALASDVERKTEAPPRLRQRASVLRARALLAMDQHGQAQKQLESSFFAPTKAAEVEYSPERAMATLLMGQAFLAQGGKENFEQAEIWFLRVSALYKKYAETYALACDGLADTYEKLGRADRASEWRARKAASAPQPTPAPAPASDVPPRAQQNGKA